MNKLNLLWMIPAFVFGFGTFWCFIVKVLSMLAWGRLADEYLASDPVGLPVQFRIARAKLGVVSYNGVIKARGLAAGAGVAGRLAVSGGPPAPADSVACPRAHPHP